MNFYVNNVCCNFAANKFMLADFNSKIVYPNTRNVDGLNMEKMEIDCMRYLTRI